MQCQMGCGRPAEIAVEMHYSWSRDNPEVVRYVCRQCWKREKDNPASLGPRRDRKVIVREVA